MCLIQNLQTVKKNKNKSKNKLNCWETMIFLQLGSFYTVMGSNTRGHTVKVHLFGSCGCFSCSCHAVAISVIYVAAYM